MTLMLPRAKLAGVLGMMGSSHDGEVLAAARQAERIRRDAGVTWAEIIAPEATIDPPPSDWRALVLWCLRHPNRLSAWERTEFLPSLIAYRQLSPRQTEILTAIARKCRMAS
jgi:hypothetical protein